MARASEFIKRSLPRRFGWIFQASGDQFICITRLNHETKGVVVHAQKLGAGGVRNLRVHQPQYRGAEVHPCCSVC